MLDALTITEAEAAGLSEVAALDLAMARDFAARAMAETDPGIAADLARCYQRMARSYRQSLALKVRLAREIAAAERVIAELPPPAIPRDAARIDARVAQLRGPIRRVIWAEHEPAEDDDPEDDMAGYYFDLLEQRLYLYSRDNRFGLEPLDDHVVKMCAAMALNVALARRWRSLPDPPGDDPEEPDEEPDRRSSG